MKACFTIVLWSLVLASPFVAAQEPLMTDVAIHTAQTTWRRPVMSMQELRQNKLVRQTWDSSCGAAALSTLLTYHVGVPISEVAVATIILRGADPRRVKQRGGFSLLDLKRFVAAIGLVGDGYGSMTLQDLGDNKRPAIVPIHLRGLDHFVVYRGQVADRVLLGDPAFGNITMTIEAFELAWRSRIAFYVHKQVSGDSILVANSELEQIHAADIPVVNIDSVSRIVRDATNARTLRQLPVAARMPGKVSTSK